MKHQGKPDWSAPEARIILSAMGKNGIGNRREFSDQVGMKDSTMRTRMQHPETTIMYEFRAWVKALRMSDDEIIKFVRS